MKRFKRHLLKLCLVLAGFCAALVLAEGFVRVFYPYSRDHAVPSGLFEIDDDLGWKLTEGKKAVHHSRHFEAVYQINTLGYRDRPRNVLKVADIYRILLYGDSQDFGWGIPAEQRFSNLIEAQEPRLEMWNLAVPGYGLDQEVLSYEKQGQLFNADEVIFSVSQSTLRRTGYDYIYRKHKPRFEMDDNEGLRLIPVQGETNVWTRVFYKVLSPLYLPYFLDRRLGTSKRASQQSGHAQNRNTTMGGHAIGQLEKGILDRARDLARERKQRMTVISHLPKAPGEDLKEFCDQRAIGFLQIVLPKEDPDLSFDPHDRHWNPRAHELITEQLLFQLKTRIRPAVEDE